ncbi:MAG: hypothetical protein AAF808_13245 [Cyanobacteria bacterium P01_D01_bin.2]
MVSRYRHVFLLALAALIFATGYGAVNHSLQAQPSPTIVCSYDPSTGIPNPLGMRTFITLTETGGTTEVVYQQLGTFVPGPVEAIFTSERALIFPNRSIDMARQLLLTDASYYQELVGFDEPDGFAPIDDTLICRAEAVVSPPSRVGPSAELPDLGGAAPRPELPNLGTEPPSSPTDSSTPATFYETIAGLADGNYRYVSGPADGRIYSDSDLLNRGGVLFVFRKTGDDLIGTYSYIDGEAICVTGRISGNTVSGQAYPADGTARDLAETFAAWGSAPFLRVRRTQGGVGERYYASATLELNDFSRINAGSSLPPSRCQ